MRRWSFIVGFLGLLTIDVCVHAQSPQIEHTHSEQSASVWTVNKAKSTLTFSGMQSGEAFSGSFSIFDAVINFDPDRLDNATVVVTIAMNSVETDDLESSNALPGKEWFDIRKFPVAIFEASDFKHLGDDSYNANYVAKGNLTIKDVTKFISLPFTLKIDNHSARMDAALTLNRTRYKIGTGLWASKDWVDHNIEVNIHLEAHQNK